MKKSIVGLVSLSTIFLGTAVFADVVTVKGERITPEKRGTSFYYGTAVTDYPRAFSFDGTNVVCYTSEQPNMTGVTSTKYSVAFADQTTPTDLTCYNEDPKYFVVDTSTTTTSTTGSPAPDTTAPATTPAQ